MSFRFPPWLLLSAVLTLRPFTAHAESVEFHVPAQAADTALLEFAKQSKTEVLFASDELHRARSNPLRGRFEVVEALSQLLTNTGFSARHNGGGKFVVTATVKPTGSIRGRLLRPDGHPAPGLRVKIFEAQQSVLTDFRGDFFFRVLPPGLYRLVATGVDYQTLELTNTRVLADRIVSLVPQTIQPTAIPRCSLPSSSKAASTAPASRTAANCNPPRATPPVTSISSAPKTTRSPTPSTTAIRSPAAAS